MTNGDCMITPKRKARVAENVFCLAVFALCSVAADTFTLAQPPPVIINEVLANEPGSAVALEWIELYNRSDSTLDLSGYVFVSDRDSTALTGLALPPDGYGILARTLIGGTGNITFESYWGDSSGVWGDTEHEDYPAMTAKMKLRNTADTIFLRAPDGSVSSCRWEIDVGDGISLERVRPGSVDETDSFMPSHDSSGSTPGRINSWTPRPNDVTIDSAEVTIAPQPPREDSLITLTIPVVNIGLGRSTENTLTVALDMDHDVDVDSAETLAVLSVPIVEETQSVALVCTLQLPGGFHDLLFVLGPDGNSSNNVVRFGLKVAYARPELVINEYLCDPAPDRSEEWIELYNRSDHVVLLSGWRIGDALAQRVITYSPAGIIPGTYAVVCEDLAAFAGVHPVADGQLLFEVGGWRKLNNDGDRIILTDGDGWVVDSLSYDTAYGGSSAERVDPDNFSGSPDNWQRSLESSGGTPGRINSRARRPNDLALDSCTEAITPFPPHEGDRVSLQGRVRNVGFGSSAANQLTIVEDTHADGGVSEKDTLVVLAIPNLAEGDSLDLYVQYAFSGGRHRLVFRIGDDGNLLNNTRTAEFKVPFERPEVVINEFLPDPPPGGPEEWVELYNRSGHDVDLGNWRIGDSSAQAIITATAYVLPAEGYVVVCENRAALEPAYREIDPATIIEVANWRTLNNTEDQIILRDDVGYAVDSLTYGATYDGRSVERINPDRASSDADNWWESVDPLGATPGRRNSTAVEYADVLGVTVAPNPFAAGEQVQIGVAVPFRVSLTAQVYDVNGRKIKTLVDHQPTASGILAWDGRDDDGQLLPPGVYILMCETSDGGVRKIVLAVKPVR